MAIDTAEKRRSVAGVPFLPLGVNVTPNLSKDQEWRQQAAWSYSGILATVTEVIVPTPGIVFASDALVHRVTGSAAVVHVARASDAKVHVATGGHSP
jgi:hypothetical protein